MTVGAQRVAHLTLRGAGGEQQTISIAKPFPLFSRETDRGEEACLIAIDDGRTEHTPQRKTYHLENIERTVGHLAVVLLRCVADGRTLSDAGGGDGGLGWAG